MDEEYGLLKKIKANRLADEPTQTTQTINSLINSNINSNNLNRRKSSFNFYRKNSFPQLTFEDDENNNQILVNKPIDFGKDDEKNRNFQLKIEKTKRIIKILKESVENNENIKNNIKSIHSSLLLKQNLIIDNIDRIKRLMRPKQKKHIKYNQFLPLCTLYNFSSKKIYRYYQLFDVVGNSTLCNSHSKPQTNNDSRVQTYINRQENRFDFSPTEDKYLSKDWTEINWKQIALYEMKRSIIECFIRKLELSGFYKYKKWSANEDQILKKAILYYGPRNWQQISYCLEGRNNSQCFHRWMKGINPKIKRTKWTLEEDLTLGIALKVYGNNKWSRISYHIPNRTDIQCRERYCNILDPKLTDVRWSIDEDLKLISLQAQYGNKWSLIAKAFGDRTDNTCWRRYKYLRYINSSSNVGEMVASNSLSFIDQSFKSGIKDGERRWYKDFLSSDDGKDNQYDIEEDYDMFDDVENENENENDFDVEVDVDVDLSDEKSDEVNEKLKKKRKTEEKSKEKKYLKTKRQKNSRK